MRFIDLRRLSGPNVFSKGPVTVARLELDELAGQETTGYPGFAGRLTALLPGLRQHHCAAGRPGGFLAAMERGTYFGHVTEHVALELSGLAGREVCLGRTMWAGADGRYDVMLECPQDEPADSRVPALLLAAAVGIVRDLVAGGSPELAGDIEAIAHLIERERLGVSTAAIAAAARRRGIPVRRVGALSLLQLGYGQSRRLVCGALTEQTSALGVDIATDKMLAKQLLASAGIPVPEGIVAGHDYRVLVIDGRVAAAAQLCPASVTGDGTHTISQLVAQVNADPRRGDGHTRELTRIVVDDEVLRHLDADGLDGCSVPASGQLVAMRRNANLSTGGTSRDVTDLVHDDVAAMCRRAAAVVGLDICGIDIRLPDICAPVGPGAVIELNACPGLRMHLSPTEGRPRDVAAAVVESLYPPGASARIPIIAVTGTNGKTTTVRMIGHVLAQAGLRVGMATTDGVYCAGRLVHDADAAGPRSARLVLDDTVVEAAVLETARDGIVRGGLGYDQADVAVVTNITADHLGADGIDDLDELIHVKALVAEEVAAGGSVVLNADDPAAAALADRPAVRANDPVIRFFTLEADNPVAEQHKRAGGLCYEVRDGELVEIEAGQPRSMISIAELPGAFGGRARHLVANALAAVAACRAAGVGAKDIRRGLATFTPEQANPGRGNAYRAG